MENKTYSMGTMPSLLPKEYLLQSINEIYKNGLPKGLKTTISNLDEVFRLDRGRVVTITGVPNYGKSEFVDFLTVTFNKLYGMKTLYFSPENQPLSFHMTKLVSKYTNKQLKETNEEQITNTASYICDNFLFCNYEKITKLSQILEIGVNAIKEKDVSILVIDAYNKIESDKPNEQIETEFIGKIMDELCRFAIKYNILVILVAHPKKMTYDTKSASYMCPNAYDINGSANFYNKSDFVLIVHRDFKHEETIIKCEKVKFSNYGKIGECRLRYDINSGNYYNANKNDKRYYDEEDEVNTKYTPIKFTIPTMPQTNPLDVEVSLYKGVSDNVGTTVNLKDFLFTEQYKTIAEEIRKGNTIEERHDIKNKYRSSLPCATISGRFSERKRDKIVDYSGLIAIDIDYKGNEDIISQVPEILKKMDFIIYAGKSISGDGYFAICKIDKPECLKQHYLALEQDFKECGITLDASCKDITRLRFASYNPEPYYNPYALIYYKVREEGKKEKSVSVSMNPKEYHFYSNTSDSLKKVEESINYLRNNNLSLPDDYNSWFKIGMSLCSEFGEAGRQYFHSISSLSPKYEKQECDNQYDKFIGYGKDNNYTLGTLMYMFKEAKCA